MHWAEYFIKMAELVAQKSKDPRTKVGIVVVGPDHEIRSTGFNGFPRGVRENAVIDCPKCKATGSRRGASMEVLGEEGFCVECKGVGKILSLETLDSNRWEVPTKYDYVTHAEANAVFNAARMGTPMNGCTAYFNYEPYPCKGCAMGLIQSGIHEWIGPNRVFPSHFGSPWSVGDQYLNTPAYTMAMEAGVSIIKLPYEGE